MTVIRPNAARIQAALEYVAAHPGITMRAATFHMLGELVRNDEPYTPTKEQERRYKRAASVIEKLVCDRHVRQVGDRIYPWNAKQKVYAEALERAALVAPDHGRFLTTLALAKTAWSDAGDENRVRTLEALATAREARHAI